MPTDNFIHTDSYYTDKNHPRDFGDKAALGTSAFFNAKFLTQLMMNRKVALAGKFDRYKWATESMNIFQLIENCGGKFHIEGLNNINKTDDPVVFISNHMGTMETMIFPGILASRRPVTFVVKESLVSHWLFGPVMRVRNPITVARHDPVADFKKVMTDGVEHLENGKSVVVFPQSKRVVDFDPGQFNKLGIKLAKKAKAHVVPIAIKTDFWKNGTVVKDLGGINRKLPIYIQFGEPFKIEGAGKTEHEQVIDFISDHLKKWNN
ncbi:MAG: 1-acyl-sn-glycerol-3-phosphate acyltransferase [Cytophagales bacterium]|nr:1-acyl-sn-glycerol-3-phosphate acyltransferase [Cytophagales bacterium]